MTDLAGALADTSHLTPFEDKDVVQVGIEIPGAAGGLRDAMSIEPQEFRQGDTVHVALECVVSKVRYEPIDKDEPDGPQRRVHVFRADGATIVGFDAVGQQIADQKERVRRAKEEASGILRLQTVDELIRAHGLGQHTKLLDGCPACDEEVEAMQEEANTDG